MLTVIEVIAACPLHSLSLVLSRAIPRLCAPCSMETRAPSAADAHEAEDLKSQRKTAEEIHFIACAAAGLISLHCHAWREAGLCAALSSWTSLDEFASLHAGSRHCPHMRSPRFLKLSEPSHPLADQVACSSIPCYSYAILHYTTFLYYTLQFSALYFSTSCFILL